MTWRGHVLLFVNGALLVAIGEGVYAATGGASTAAIATSLLATVSLAAPLGLAQALLVWLVLRVDAWLAWGRWLRRSTAAARDEPRTPVIELHAIVLASLVALTAFAGGIWIALAALVSVTDVTLRSTLTIAAAIGGILAALMITAVVTKILSPLFAWLDERLGLPRPKRRSLQLLVYIVLPTAGVLVPLGLQHRAALGLWEFALWWPLFLLGEALLLIAWRRWAPRRLAKRRVRAPLMLLGWLTLLGGLVATSRAAHNEQAADETVFGKRAMSLLRSAADVDRDGFSGIFGDSDCAPFDAAIHPLAADIPGNAVDENCDGVDATAPKSGGEIRPPSWTSALAQERAGLEPKRYNIVWVIVDAIRADHTSLVGYKRKTTPFLDSMAKKSLVFHNATAQSSATMLSLPSMFTGRNPASITWKKKRRLQLDKVNVTLAERLKSEGYRTGIVVDGYITKVLPAMTQGFDTVMSTWLDKRRQPWHRRSASVATTLAIEWLEKDRHLASKKSKPFFLVVYSSNPHDPYRAHPEMSANFGKSEIDRYDAEIEFSDRHVGFLVDYLRYRRPLWDNTVFVFTSDHGEEFGEHDGKIHAYTCYRESVHVPLLLRIPKVKGKRVKHPVALIDIAPTLFEVLGLSDGMDFDGTTLLVPTFAPETMMPARPFFCSVLSQKKKQGNFFRRAVRSGDRALMHDGVTGVYELYNTRADLAEMSNIAGRGSEASERSRLADLLRRSMTGNLAESRLTK